jgi:hypothetical protein
LDKFACVINAQEYDVVTELFFGGRTEYGECFESFGFMFKEENDNEATKVVNECDEVAETSISSWEGATDV